MKKYIKKEDYSIRQITYKIAEEWIINKHYSHRMPNIIYAFGLFDNNSLIGVCSFGVSNTPHNEMICGNLSNSKVLELNRVVIDEDAPLNSASFFISKIINFLKKNNHYKVLISYADSEMEHTGYIYQALNFYYCGISKGSKKITIKGKHPRTILKNSEDMEKEYIQTSDKHRYVYFLGNKTENKELKINLKYKIMKYPKDKIKPKRYDSPKLKEKQKTLL